MFLSRTLNWYLGWCVTGLEARCGEYDQGDEVHREILLWWSFRVTVVYAALSVALLLFGAAGVAYAMGASDVGISILSTDLTPYLVLVLVALMLVCDAVDGPEFIRSSKPDVGVPFEYGLWRLCAEFVVTPARSLCLHLPKPWRAGAFMFLGWWSIYLAYYIGLTLLLAIVTFAFELQGVHEVVNWFDAIAAEDPFRAMCLGILFVALAPFAEIYLDFQERGRTPI